MILVAGAATAALGFVFPLLWALALSMFLWLWALWRWALLPDVLTLEGSGWCCWQRGKRYHSAMAQPVVVLAPWLLVLRMGSSTVPLFHGCTTPSILRHVMRWAKLQAGGPLHVHFP